MLLLTRVLDWQDILEEKGAWDALIWFGGLVMLSTQLDKAGFPQAFARAAARLRRGLAVVVGARRAGRPLHLRALRVREPGGARDRDVPGVLRGGGRLRRAAARGGHGVRRVFEPERGDDALRHGSGADRFRRGYVTQGRWWRIGFLVSLLHLAIWLPIGFLWWKAIGLW